ncbi:MAG: response regulator [Rhodovulum sulfidophilum]|uniref:Response regulator n=1 Tax=Rhodovulum sulfidophilum TaxID=35806 RepID=A0A2W5N727_RHOSU|nr:MAG: response regulator [Rhodovulum sulfidophilum]
MPLLPEPGPAPRSTAGPRRHCLFGVTILLVEDSRGASEALRLFAAESGARLRRADSLASAGRHLAVYRPSAMIVDLGLPDGDGLGFIRHLTRAATPLRSIVATSGQDAALWGPAARAAGAAACLEKPVPSLRAFQECLLSILPDAAGRPDGAAGDPPFGGRASTRAAFDADLRRAQRLLAEALLRADRETIAYCAQFVGSVGEMIADPALSAAARAAARPGSDAAELMARLGDRVGTAAGGAGG